MRSNADGVPRSHEASTGCPSFDEKRRRRSPAEPRGFNQMSTRVRAEGTSNQLGQQQVASSLALPPPPPPTLPVHTELAEERASVRLHPDATTSIQEPKKPRPEQARLNTWQGQTTLLVSCTEVRFGREPGSS